MKKARNGFIKNLHYLCLIGVIILGLMTVVGTGGGGGGGGAGDTTTTLPEVSTSPTATITSPLDGSTYLEGDTITFAGTGKDTEDGTLTSDSLVWTSDIAGEIGTDTSFERSDLSIGHHTITLTATDSDGTTGSDSVDITVGSPLLYVPSEYSTIQEAIDAAKEGDTIKIAAGTYHEQDLKVFGGLRIEGESAESTIIRGFGNDDIIDTAYDSDTTKAIVIKKVTVENGYNGISLSGDILELTDCIVQNNNSSGISLWGSVATISDCEIVNNSDDGVHGGTITISNSVVGDNTGDGIYCDNLDMSHCIIYGNSDNGISLYGGTVTISNSVIKNNTGDGIYCENGTITNTIVANNTGDGIDCDNPDISYCTIYGNDDGISALFGSSGTIKNSIIAMNTDCGIYEWDSSLNLSNINFYGNSECNWEVDWVCHEGAVWYDAIDSILTDPIFVDAENGDFHLQGGSPALTASDTGGEIGAYGNGGNPPE